MSADDYAKKQTQRDAQYEREYQAWVKSMSPAERREAEALGLLKPCLAKHGNGSAMGDAADSALMRIGDDPALLVDADPLPPEQPQPAEPTHDTEAIYNAIRCVVAEILYHNNARLTAECIALVSGLAYDGSSMSDIAKRHGITRAAVSKRCVELTELLDLPPSRAMRSLTARKRYRDARIRSTRSHEHNNHSSKSKG
jgi:DNA-directed RNA polymerase specialized sigma24 family protein